jgi:hypothetical protein
MYARVTMLEVDPLRIDIDDAVALYRRDVLPELHEQPGYEGAYVFTTPEGKALLLTFWETEEQAEANAADGFYSETLSRFATLFKAPPGRDRYLVALEDAPLGTHV